MLSHYGRTGRPTVDAQSLWSDWQAHCGCSVIMVGLVGPLWMLSHYGRTGRPTVDAQSLWSDWQAHCGCSVIMVGLAGPLWMLSHYGRTGTSSCYSVFAYFQQMSDCSDWVVLC